MAFWPLRHGPLAAALAASLAAGHAEGAPGGWSACFLNAGVLSVPAKAAGLTGVFVLDAATPQSQIDATQASYAGLEDGPVSVPVRVGGRRIEALPVQVLALDARTRTMPTPVTGVLGADVLKGLVLDVMPDPCRFRLTERAAAGAGRAVVSLPLVWVGGAPAVQAAVSDGATAEQGAFRIATGSALTVSLASDAARMASAPKDAVGLTAPLRALSLGGLMAQDIRAGVGSQPDPGALGAIGEPVWSQYGFRLDLSAMRLTLYAPTKKARRYTDGPLDRSGARPASVLDVAPDAAVAGVEQAGEDGQVDQDR